MFCNQDSDFGVGFALGSWFAHIQYQASVLLLYERTFAASWFYGDSNLHRVFLLRCIGDMRPMCRQSYILSYMVHPPRSKSATSIVEEVLSSVTHGLGAAAGIAGLVLGIVSLHAPLSFRIGFVVYAASLILLMTISTLYHALSFSRARRVFLVLDHSSIFILIAGSYTPFILTLYAGWACVVMLAVVWAIAAASIAINASIPKVMERASMAFYIGFGWLALLLLPKLSLLSPAVLWLLVAGGVLYTVGAVFMALNKPFFHLSWHVFVLAAAASHFFAILRLA